MQRTKIVATLGPASWSEETIKRLILEGVRIFRLNFSHADYEKFKEIVDTLRKFETQTRPITILGDLQGPVIRLGNFNSFRVNPGDDVVFVYAKETAESKKVPVPYAPFFEIVKEGNEVLVEGGALTFRVTKVSTGEAICQAMVEGEVKPRKTVTIRGKDVPLPTITEKDMKDIEFAVKAGIDVIALSFVRKPQDIQQLRDTLFDLGAEDVKIMAKIETRSAVESLESILQLSDAVLVARGDLANYYELEEIYRLQNFIIREARKQGKPSVVATQLLESMINNPIPTRSEVVDVITAVRMGADALMLAGEQPRANTQ
jgi:Pyruvate kinase